MLPPIVEPAAAWNGPPAPVEAPRGPAPPDPRRRRGRAPVAESLASSILVVIAVNLVQRSLGFGRAMLFCRWMEPEQLGHWEMAYGFLLLAAPLAVLGLPGSFGRYLERFRRQGTLRLFLRRATTATLLLSGAMIALMALWRREMAELVFGDPARGGLMLAVLGCLALVILHHFLEAVFAGLRMFRVVSTMHFVQSTAFAVVSLALLAEWRNHSSSVVVGYAAACALSAVGVLGWAAFRLRLDADAGPPSRHAEFWPPLMRFAMWVWATNLLSNVFAVVDRYMIVHCGRYTPDEALVEVGNYHTANIVPALMVSFANLLVGAMTPHLSHDWEAGRRDAVSGRLNLALKLTTLAMLIAGVAVLAVCPLLFEWVFRGKYATGLAVLPWTVATCVWFSLLLVSQTYVWCAERTRSATAPLVVGLATNVALNALLLPVWGLVGAVFATAVATLVALLGQLWVNRACGMTLHRGTLLAAFAPVMLALGPGFAAVGAGALLALAVGRGWIFTHEEIEQLSAGIADRLSRPLALRAKTSHDQGATP